MNETKYIPPATQHELDNPAPEGQGLRHNQNVRIAKTLASNGFTADEIVARCTNGQPENEVRKIAEWAVDHPGDPTPQPGHGNGSKPQPAQPTGYHPNDIKDNVRNLLDGLPKVEPSDILNASPEKIPADPRGQASLFLSKLYQPTDLLNIVTDLSNRGETLTTAEWLTRFQSGIPTGPGGAYLRMNPLTNTTGVADADVAAFRFALIECDCLPGPEQGALAMKLREVLSIVSIMSAGGKSLHTRVAVNAPNLETYRKQVKELLDWLAPYGVDLANKNPSRLSRLPGAMRSNVMQTLLYLNPAAACDRLDLTKLQKMLAGVRTVNSNGAAWPKSKPSSDPLKAALSDGRPKVRLPGANRLLSDFATELADIVGKELYIRNGDVVRLVAGRLEPMTPAMFRSWVEKHICGYKVKGAGEDLIDIDLTMTHDDAAGVLASPQFRERLRPVLQVNDARLPVMRVNGVELLPVGYDAESKTLTLPTIEYAPDMPLADALATINDLFGEFVFADEGRSKSVAVAALTGLFCKHVLPRQTLRPCFITVANAEGAGKSMLATVATLPALGNMPAGSKADDENEIIKMLVTTVKEARPILFYDNLKGHLSSAALEAFLTAPSFEGRKLGVNEFISGDNLATVFITGNGLTVSPDMRRRSLFVELRLEVERAEDRQFKRPLDVPTLTAMRPTILAAIWALVRNWQAKGCPKPSRSHSAFVSWANVVGGIVEAAGFGCPLETSTVAAVADTDGEDMRRLVESMEIGNRYEFAGLVELAKRLDCFAGLIDDDLDRRSKRRLSSIFQRYQRRLVADRRFNFDGKGHSRRYWSELVSNPDSKQPVLHDDMIKHDVSVKPGKTSPTGRPEYHADHAIMQSSASEQPKKRRRQAFPHIPYLFTCDECGMAHPLGTPCSGVPMVTCPSEDPTGLWKGI